ncbi:MAG: ferredoxin [Caedibacter sp. 38-128]|nr:(2Fe-2S) ferredoxin domain-containing protein [Holosporales bacterium]OJX07235.1 MAG: ferredoxin [Caedibacter sp. 38-128]
MAPSYKHHVFICQNQRPEGHPRGCCLAKGTDKILEYMKVRIKELGLKNIRINKAGCLDQCEKGPAVVIYPEDVWYTIKTIEDAETLIQSHLIKEQKVGSLLMK